MTVAAETPTENDAGRETNAVEPKAHLAPVMVVDDSVVSRGMVGKLIERGLGRPTIYAVNGRDALAAIALSKPSVVITDLHMPVMGGLELVEAMRSTYPNIPIVLMTAYGSEEVAMLALKAGAASYVGKAGMAKHLIGTLEQVFRVVDRKQARQRIRSCQSRQNTEYVLENDLDLISPLLSAIHEDLVNFRIGDETTRMRIGMALQESLANALFHGNLECSSDLRQEDERNFYRLAEERRTQDPYRTRKIRLETTIDSTQARFVITDEGFGFDVASLDKPFDPEDLLKIGGRGMLLIRTFMDHAIHNSVGNQLTMFKNN
jgi:CheY-like chemotaxis protein